MYYKQKIQKLKQNTKAMSPVVASIILIAVTVAVSIAVAAWMGGLAGGFMETEQVQVNTVDFTAGTPGTIQIKIMNTGTTSVTISDVQVNGASCSTNMTSTTKTIEANGELTVDVASNVELGNNYQVQVITSKNNAFSITGVAH